MMYKENSVKLLKEIIEKNHHYKIEYKDVSVLRDLVVAYYKQHPGMASADNENYTNFYLNTLVKGEFRENVRNQLKEDKCPKAMAS